jgi:hypothetical protein
VPIGLPDGRDRDPAIEAHGLDIDVSAGPAVRGQVPCNRGVEEHLLLFEQTREVLLDCLSERPGTDDRSAAVEEVTFLKNLRT